MTSQRNVLREKFQRYGAISLTSDESLTLLLSYASPWREPAAVAGALMSRFGSLGAVFNADHSDLVSVPGVGRNGAACIRLVFGS